MYCTNCGTGLGPGLSYCNRCGFNLREKTDSNTGVISAFLTAITVLGTAGLAIMLAGTIVLKRKTNLDPQLIGVFMTFTFMITVLTEYMLIRSFSKLLELKESSKIRSLPPPITNDLRLPRASSLGEPVPSVTENTTHTLEYVRRD